MGTCSYVLTGTEKGMTGEHRQAHKHVSLHLSPPYVLTYHNLSPAIPIPVRSDTFGSTCHGAGRAKSRAGSRRQSACPDGSRSGPLG